MTGSSGFGRGMDWGVPSRVPDGATITRGDADAAIATGPVVLDGGDLHRGLGRPVARGIGEESTMVLVDSMLCRVETDDGRLDIPAVAHVVVGRLIGPGRFAACVNAGFLGDLSLSPRSHPGDGRIEIVEFDPSMGVRERLMARRRAVTGSHVPHPAIRTTSATTWSTERRAGEPLRIDGVRIPRWRRLDLSVRPGSLTVHL